MKFNSIPKSVELNMSAVLQLFIGTIVLTTVFGQNATLGPVTNGTQDYIKIVQAQLLHRIKISELENDAIDTRFLDRISVIELQQQIVLNETQQVNQTVISLQALNLLRKYCIQKYDSQFITHQSAKDQMSRCINIAMKDGNMLSFNARYSTSKAENYATNRLPKNVESCMSYANNQTRFEQCYIDYAEVAVKVVDDNLANAQALREKSLFEMNSIVNTAVRCSYDVEKDVTQAITSTSKKISDCVDNMGRITDVGGRKALN